MQPEKLAAAVDENTIGVAAVLGTTYTGGFEDVATLDKLLGEDLYVVHIRQTMEGYHMNALFWG